MTAADRLISPEYRALQRQMHASPRGYGQKGDKWAGEVEGLCALYGRGEILDYGCGQGSLGRALRSGGLTVREYDPAIRGKDGEPQPADLVVCTDVLEHVEPEKIEAVLADLRRVTLGHLFAVIALTPAGKTLPDGRNAHILLQPRDWWATKLRAHFEPVRAVPCRSHKEYAAVWRPL